MKTEEQKVKDREWKSYEALCMNDSPLNDGQCSQEKAFTSKKVNAYYYKPANTKKKENEKTRMD